MIKKILLLVLSVLVLIALLTYLALEWDEVALIYTSNGQSNEFRVTHIWYVEEENALLLEAGDPNNPWIQDLQHSSVVKIVSSKSNDEVWYQLTEKPGTHELIRQKMAEKYGWRDWWIQIVFNPSNSYLIEATQVVNPNQH